MSGVTTSSVSLAWSLRNWVILDYQEANGLTIRPWATFLSYGLTNRSTTRKKPVSIRFLGCKHKRMKVNQENVSPVIGAPHESNRILIHRQIISLAAAVHLWSGVFVCQENKDNLRPHIRCVTVFHQEFTEYNRDLFENQVILSSLQLEIHGEAGSKVNSCSTFQSWDWCCGCPGL